MKKIFLFLSILLSVLAFGCSTIDVATSDKVNLPKKMKKIAIFPFQVSGANWGPEFSDAISHQFFKIGKIEVVEREMLQKIIKEKAFAMSGFVDEGKAVEIGKFIGADVIIVGRGSALKFRFPGEHNYIPNLIDTFSLKALNVETGALIITVRKKPGRDWDGEYRAKWCCSGTMIWNRDDITEESSKYDEIAEKIVINILDAIKETKEKK